MLDMMKIPAVRSLYDSDADPSIKFALATLGVAMSIFPSVLLADTINALSQPYPAPMKGSYRTFEAQFGFVDAQAPIDANINVGISGNGTVTAVLPAPLVSGVFGAVKVGFSRGDNDPPSDWSAALAGSFTNGDAYAFPATQFEYASGANTKGDAIILVTRSLQNGPAICAARLRNVTYPNTDLQNGSPNMVAANGIALTIAGATATQRATMQVATKVTDTYSVLQDTLLMSALSGYVPRQATARISDMAPSRAVKTLVALRAA